MKIIHINCKKSIDVDDRGIYIIQNKYYTFTFTFTISQNLINFYNQIERHLEKFDK